MSPREKTEFDRVNALPRKTEGMVAYYYKPPTKYPARIYVFMHAEIWQDRNRRPMGLYNAFPFLKRQMNKEEIEYHHFDHRLCYHQYEDWDKLIYAEEKEAEQLDKEHPGYGAKFLTALKDHSKKYVIGERSMPVTPKPQTAQPDPTSILMQDLIRNGGNYTSREIADMMKQEQQGENRTVIMILLRELYKESAGEREEKPVLTVQLIEHKAAVSQQRSRRNFARRTFARNPLFALLEIRERYPEYTEEQLAADLKRKSIPVKKDKSKTPRDLRRCQLSKLAGNLKYEQDTKSYHDLCNRIVMLENAHKLRLDIPLAVSLDGLRKAYYFHWLTPEAEVKAFVNAANTKGASHDVLTQKFKTIIKGLGTV